MTQDRINQLSEALRRQGLTWNQTNFAVSLIRNECNAALEEAAKHFSDSDTFVYRSECAAAIRSMKT